MNLSILKKVLILGTTLLLAAGGSRAANAPPVPGCHFVMVKTSPGIQSIYVVGSGEIVPGLLALKRSVIVI